MIIKGIYSTYFYNPATQVRQELYQEENFFWACVHVVRNSVQEAATTRLRINIKFTSKRIIEMRRLLWNLNVVNENSNHKLPKIMSNTWPMGQFLIFRFRDLNLKIFNKILMNFSFDQSMRNGHGRTKFNTLDFHKKKLCANWRRRNSNSIEFERETRTRFFPSMHTGQTKCCVVHSYVCAFDWVLSSILRMY